MITTKRPAEPAAETQPRRSQPRGMKRARELLDVATDLFISQGIDETTIDDIAAHAGIAKGTFYHHYDSKAALLQAIREAFIEDFDNYVDNALAKQHSDDPRVRLGTWVRAVCEAYALMTQRQDIAFASDGFRWTPRNQRHLEDLVVLIGQGNANGCWLIADPYKTAIFIQRGLIGVMDDMLLTGKSLKGVHKDVMELVHHAAGLQPPGKP